MEKTHTKVKYTRQTAPLWVQQFYGLPKDRKEAEARPVTIVNARRTPLEEDPEMYENHHKKEQALAILQGGDPILVTAPYMDEIVETVISLDDLGRDMDIDWETITQEEQDELVREHFGLMLDRFETFYRERLDPKTFKFYTNAETVAKASEEA